MTCLDVFVVFSIFSFLGGRGACFCFLLFTLPGFLWTSQSCVLPSLINFENSSVIICSNIYSAHPPLFSFFFWHSSYACYIFWYYPVVLGCSTRLFSLLSLLLFALKLGKFLVTFYKFGNSFLSSIPSTNEPTEDILHSPYLVFDFWYFVLILSTERVSISLLPLTIWSCMLPTLLLESFIYQS